MAIENEEIPFSLIQNTLKITAEQVDEWVVSTIVVGLIDAKIDQLKQVVTVSRASPRLFRREQWAQLHGRLDEWKNNISTLLGLINSSRSEHKI